MDIGDIYIDDDFMKDSHTKFLYIAGEQPQLQVPTQALREFSPFFSFSLGEELSREDPTI